MWCQTAQWFEYLKVVFLKLLNTLLCQDFANQVTIKISIKDLKINTYTYIRILDVYNTAQAYSMYMYDLQLHT